jgi:hypothetical protein
MQLRSRVDLDTLNPEMWLVGGHGRFVLSDPTGCGYENQEDSSATIRVRDDDSEWRFHDVSYGESGDLVDLVLTAHTVG